MHLLDVATQNVANAIVLRAVEDYRSALNGTGFERQTPEKCIEEIERFFRSKWYKSLTKVDGEYLISQLKQEHIENERRRNESNVNSSNT